MADPYGSGREVLAYAVDNSDRPYPGSDPRGDVESPRVFKPGDDYYFSIPVLIPRNFPLVPRGSWVMFAEVYGTPYNGSPTNSLGVRNDLGDGKNHFAFGGRSINAANTDYAWEGAAVDGRWHTFILHIHFATDNTGVMELWFDGVRQTFLNGSQTLRRATMVPGATWDGTTGNFLDINSYRPVDTIPGTATLYHGAPAVGPTLASVQNTLLGSTVERRGP